MKTLIIYNSIHQRNTEKIAKAMAEEIKADLAKPNEINLDEIGKYDIIGFGSGIYFSKHHITLLNLVDKLPSLDKKAFIFSTKGLTPDWTNHRKLRKKLLAKGFSIIGEFSCKGFDNYGPFKLIGGINKGRPDEKDIKSAREFIKKIVRKI